MVSFVGAGGKEEMVGAYLRGVANFEEAGSSVEYCNNEVSRCPDP